MIALICCTVQFSPAHAETLSVVPAKAFTVGCSLTPKSGISQLTAGSVPAAASFAKRSYETTRCVHNGPVRM